MVRPLGSRVRMALGFELSYGVAPEGDKFWRVPFASTTLGTEQALMTEERFGSGRDATALGREALSIDGDIVVPVDFRFLGIWLKALFGEPTTVGSGPYSHEFRSGGWALPSMTLELGMPEMPRYASYLGTMANTLTLQMQRSGLVNATVGLIAQREAVETFTLLAAPVDMEVARFASFNGSVIRNGASLGNLISAQLTYSNNLDRLETIRGWGEIDGADPSFASLSGRLEARFSDDGLYQQALSSDPCDILFQLIAGPFSLRWTAHEVFLSRPRLAVQGPAGIQASFDWHAVRDAGEERMATILFTTDVEKFVIEEEGVDPWDTTYVLGSSWDITPTYPAGASLYSIVHSRELDMFVAMNALSGAAQKDALVSIDGGSTWTYAASSAGSASSRYRTGAAWSATLGRFASMRYGTPALAIYSSDGLTWTSTSITGAASANLYAVCWSAPLGMFIGVGGVGTILRSADGITWTAVTHSLGTSDLFGCCWSDALGLFVIVGNPRRIYTSPDGINWTNRSQTGTSYALRGVCWSPDLGIFVAGGQGFAYTSPNGVTWTQTTSGIPGNRVIQNVKWIRQLGLFFAIGYTSGSLTPPASCLISQDGVTWTNLALPSTPSWLDIAWDGLRGRLVAVAQPYSTYTAVIAVMQCVEA